MTDGGQCKEFVWALGRFVVFVVFVVLRVKSGSKVDL